MPYWAVLFRISLFDIVAEHGEQRHLQGPAHHGLKAVLQGGSLQQADDRRPAHGSPGHHHWEQDSRSYRHLYWTPAAGSSWFVKLTSTATRVDSNNQLCLRWQLVLTRSSPIIFANYSLAENQRVSSISAVYSSEYLLFVVGDKVQQQRHVFKQAWCYSVRRAWEHEDVIQS